MWGTARMGFRVLRVMLPATSPREYLSLGHSGDSTKADILISGLGQPPKSHSAISIELAF